MDSLVPCSNRVARLVLESGKWVWPEDKGPGKAQACCCALFLRIYVSLVADRCFATTARNFSVMYGF